MLYPKRADLLLEEIDDDETNYLNGKRSKLFKSFPLLDYPKKLTFESENPIFIPLTSSTHQLHFTFESKPEVKISDVFLELLIK